MKFPIPTFVTAAALALCISCAKSTERVELRLRLKPGQKQTIVSTIKAEGNDYMKVNSSLEVVFTVDSIMGNEYRLVSDVVYMKNEMKTGTETETYDSRKSVGKMTDSEEEQHEMFRDLIEYDQTITVNNLGKVIKPFTYEDGTGNEEPLDMSNMQIVFPEKKVGIGDTWDSERTNSLTGQITKLHYELTDISENEIEIALKATIGGIKGVIGDNQLTGEYVLDRKDCTLISSILTMDMQMGGGKATYSIYKKPE